MSNSLIRSNRTINNDDLLKPKECVKISDISSSKDKGKKMLKTEVDTVTFNTNLKISNHSRNKLQAMSNMGYADSQKDAIEVIFNSFLENLSEYERKELRLQINVLERKDAKKAARKR